jgi:hypothetical protein
MRFALLLALAVLAGDVDQLPFAPCAAAESPCCKTCKKGKACGDSCIKADRTCTAGPGCACDASSGA